MPCSFCDCYLQQSLSPYPSSPLTPDSEEGFIMNIREEGRSTRVRNRPKPQPAKKTRVNAQRYGTGFQNFTFCFQGRRTSTAGGNNNWTKIGKLPST